MSVKFIEQSNRGLIGFWEITETVEQLMSLLDPRLEELESYHQFRNDLRKKEWLSARLLLREMLGQPVTIGYDAAGKPVLQNAAGHLSVSHSAGYVTIFYHPEDQPGIDIESIHRNTEKAARKFLSPKELNDCTVEGKLSNRDLLLRWCAKEAVFKMVPYSDIDFSEQITIDATNLSENQGSLSATFSNTDTVLHIALNYRITEDILMVWGTI